MIHINLLPEVMRKKEGTPLPQFAAYCVALLAIGLVAYAIVRYKFDTIGMLAARKGTLEIEKNAEQAIAVELQELNRETAKLSGYVDTVKELYRKRIIWAKILSDLKNIVNFDPAMSEYNTDMRYLWLTKLAGKEKNIDMDGFATAANRIAAMQMPSRLITGLMTYTPDKLPEQAEEDRINEALRQAQIENDLLRRDNPDLPVQSEKEVRLRDRLAEIRAVRSGGIALKPFSALLKPGSIKLVSTAWGSAPRPAGNAGPATEIFPSEAWSFKITMELLEPGN